MSAKTHLRGFFSQTPTVILTVLKVAKSYAPSLMTRGNTRAASLDILNSIRCNILRVFSINLMKYIDTLLENYLRQMEEA